jgi:phosphatidylglycerophosphate synthase
MAEALAALSGLGGDADGRAVVEALTRRFGAPAQLPTPTDPRLLAAPADRRAAERRLLRGLVKDTDGFMARHVERPMSLAVSRLLAGTSITPNQMTLFSIAVGLAGAPGFLSETPLWQTVGALLLLAHSILDGCDGELARLRFQESRWGGILDFWGDNVVHAVVFACMAIGWSSATDAAWPLLLGVAAVVGTIGSASVVYWRMMRPKADGGPLYTSVSAAPGRRLARLLDALSRRDFIYLVVAFALFGKAAWFLVLAGLGAPIFLILLFVLAARERIAPAVTPTGA